MTSTLPTILPPQLPTVKPPFPEVVDSSWLSDGISCPTKFNYSCVRRLRPSGESIDLIAGGAFAKALEVARKEYFAGGAPRGVAEARGLLALILSYGDPPIPERKRHKSLDRTIAAYESYLAEYPFDSDFVQPAMLATGPAVEFNFCFPLDVLHPTTGQPMLYAGRCDWIGVYRGLSWCVDEKTCSQMGEKWASNWDLRSQFMGYSYAARLHDIPVEGTLVRGTCFLKTEIKHAWTMVQHPQWKLDRWYAQANRNVARLIENWKRGIWDLALDDACTSYGGCPYAMLCNSKDPEPWIAQYYEHNDWDPLFKEAVV